MLDVFFYFQLSVSTFFMDSKVNCQISYDNWYVQKYLNRIFHKVMLLIWKEYFTRAILSFISLRCAIIARLNVIYTKFRRAMIAQLNKIWRVWACARAIARHSRPGLCIDFWSLSFPWGLFVICYCEECCTYHLKKVARSRGKKKGYKIINIINRH